ncbi:unnamed protein product [Cochlearia groenlandica]
MANSREKGENILVSVRVRPRNEKEKTRNDLCDWDCVNNTTIICNNNLPERSLFPSTYTFDKVFGFDCPTKQVYEDGAKEVALCVLEGINSSIFAYGQTSSGKTYTMTGITEFAMNDIFCYIQKDKKREYTLKFSAIEIYNEAVRDLLSGDNNQLRLLDDPERGTVVEKLIEETLRDKAHLEELLSICETQRKIGETSLNETSSRSHQILRLTIESSGREYSLENSSILAASVCFVDLAGSERASQTLSAGTRLKEGCHINRSLLTLGTVIRKLSKGRNGHIPYRDSKLTRILQNSLGGNARTAIICTMSPARSHVEQSRNTLLFATCAKEVTTNAQVNLVVSEKALVKQLQQELARMENELKNFGSNSSSAGEEFYLMLKEKEEVIAHMEEQMKELKWQRDVAQSQVENLLKSTPEDRSSMMDEQSVLSSMDYDIDLRRRSYDTFDMGEQQNSIIIINNNHLTEKAPDSLETPEKEKEDEFLLDDNTPRFSRPSLYDNWEEMVQITAKNPEENVCKEVRCIEHTEENVDLPLKTRNVEEVCPNEINYKSSDFETGPSSVKPQESTLKIEHFSNEEDNEISSLPTKKQSDDEDTTTKEKKIEDGNSIDHIESSVPINIIGTNYDDIDKNTYLALKEKVKEMQKKIEYLMNMHTPEKQESPFLIRDYKSPEFFTRSRSCRENLLTSRSPLWFENTSSSLKPSPGRPISTSFDSGNYNGSTIRGLKESDPDIDTGNSFREFVEGIEEMVRQHSIDSNVEIDYETLYGPTRTERGETTTRESPENGIGDNLDALKDARNEETMYTSNDQSHKEHADDSVQESVSKETHPTEKLHEANEQQKYSNNSQDFETQQRQIIELWSVCNVPLTHRTYFFLLFKGDPSDYVYMEVELRRLSFLKQTLSNDTEISRRETIKSLTREKEMLSKQIPKKFPWNQRLQLYKKWGIEANSKQRSLQVAHKIWTKTQDIEHVQESASLVAKLLGFVEPNRMPKEMFGLSLLPRSMENVKPSGWRFTKSFSGLRLTRS